MDSPRTPSEGGQPQGTSRRWTVPGHLQEVLRASRRDGAAMYMHKGGLAKHAK